MHEELLAWEAGANGSSPQLVLVSSGDEERTRAEGFRSPVLLDPDWTLGEAFGAGGTPSAVMIDVEGRVASEVMVGGRGDPCARSRATRDQRRLAAWQPPAASSATPAAWRRRPPRRTPACSSGRRCAWRART